MKGRPLPPPKMGLWIASGDAPFNDAVPALLRKSGGFGILVVSEVKRKVKKPAKRVMKIQVDSLFLSLKVRCVHA